MDNEITGIVLSIGRIDKLSIWYRHGFDNRVAPQIKSDMIRLLGLPHDVKTSVSVFFPQNAPNNKRSGGGGANNDQNAGRENKQRGRELTSYAATSGATTSGQEAAKPAVGLDDLLE